MCKGLIVGLGNPGSDYTWTRHNAGFLVVNHLCQKFKTEVSSLVNKKFYQLLQWKRGLADQSWLLCKPKTYMNLSGRAVSSLLGSQRISRDTFLLVIHDELDLPFGALRLKWGGGLAGHKGLKSIAQHWGSKEFARLRVGIGRPANNMTVSDYVLAPFTIGERNRLPLLLERAVMGVELVCDLGIEMAMNEFNGQFSMV